MDIFDPVYLRLHCAYPITQHSFAAFNSPAYWDEMIPSMFHSIIHVHIHTIKQKILLYFICRQNKYIYKEKKAFYIIFQYNKLKANRIDNS